MAKVNCWEILQCGRSHDCPAAKVGQGEGMHGGSKRGRFCWTVAGTLCRNEVQGVYKDKIKRCVNHCEVYKKIKDEEGGDFSMH
ncbi:MAG: hypothetical protein JW984_07715 [Deltaproteobacteria bacterium]|uniref:Uncharacterized protein n=1 Tax=Candidatus Zymogenus saltonus TaxID=2844893 RepID=A0A9D8PPN7_9DELT|nr:hypothetical protein [Candidatus Zymogenus saltonus]